MYGGEGCAGHQKGVQGLGAKCHLIAVDVVERENCQRWWTLPWRRRARFMSCSITRHSDSDHGCTEDIDDLSGDRWVNTFDTDIHPCFYVSKYALAHVKSGSTSKQQRLHQRGAVVSFTRGLGNQYLSKGV
ncbi:Glucose and ribitol dehydrogenase-like protein 2 [Tolypocladium ophioglossoides CBS 100239]|uniref:Glucose and ribitol dehydrogenase-like protein 2 n=1 Tax=Tolypocladium ophioglossoides (strain CBS 100239) TaxID=1163406 RepID=A0A0L0NMK0_TOLOC|nr:Glucose and ribitol dehydrogenase-like protein 2 [Tolypocladium ophioglossoides CBS 100239]